MFDRAAAEEPVALGPVNAGANLVRLPGGVWEAYRPLNHRGQFKVTRSRSTDGGRTWSKPEPVHDLPGSPWGGMTALLDRDGEVHLFSMRLRQEGPGRRIAIDRFIDVWHLRSHKGRTEWGEPQRVFEGYTGSIQMAMQLASGRIVLPYGSWVAGRAAAPPTGAHFCTTVYSDDGGKTWQTSPAQLVSPCYDGYNGNNYGACEPYVVQRRDGVAWMLLRTQAGFLYESFSRDGADWSDARPSLFHSSNSPAAAVRLADGRLVLVWNNCELPPRVDGQGVYGGRDALHAAVGDPEGKTWRGFREIYLDDRRNDSPPKTGDRGTAYPYAFVTPEDKVAVISGQGVGRRTLTIVDPAWLLETRRADDFSRKLDNWCVFTEFGPAKGYWRDRCPGATLAEHPDKKDAKVLHVRRAEADKPGDGAVWNFPLGTKGKLSLRLRVQPSSAGASLALNDRMFQPTDDNGESKALFRVALGPKGLQLSPGRWHDVGLGWDTKEGRCLVTVDGRGTLTLEQVNPTRTGVCYLRLRSAAATPDPAGLLVERIQVDVTP